MEPITSFEGEFEFLSSFAKLQVPIIWGDISFSALENAYQSGKSSHVLVRRAISRMTPGKAKREGEKILKKGISVNRWWNDDFRLRLMERLDFEKFSKDPELKAKLLATGDREIIEGNNWHDNFFGKCSCDNCPVEKQRPEAEQNNKGKILMRVRARLRD